MTTSTPAPSYSVDGARKAPPDTWEAGSVDDVRHAKELGLLVEVSRVLQHTLDLREVVETLLGKLAAELGMVRATLTLLNRDTQEVFIEAARRGGRHIQAATRHLLRLAR